MQQIERCVIREAWLPTVPANSYHRLSTQCFETAHQHCLLKEIKVQHAFHKPRQWQLFKHSSETTALLGKKKKKGDSLYLNPRGTVDKVMRQTRKKDYTTGLTRLFLLCIYNFAFTMNAPKCTGMEKSAICSYGLRGSIAFVPSL